MTIAGAGSLNQWIEKQSGAHREARLEDRAGAVVGDFEAIDAYHDGYEQALADLRKHIGEA
jgi:hypothetical protein